METVSMKHVSVWMVRQEEQPGVTQSASAVPTHWSTLANRLRRQSQSPTGVLFGWLWLALHPLRFMVYNMRSRPTLLVYSFIHTCVVAGVAAVTAEFEARENVQAIYVDVAGGRGISIKYIPHPSVIKYMSFYYYHKCVILYAFIRRGLMMIILCIALTGVCVSIILNPCDDESGYFDRYTRTYKQP